jgi:predicted RNase H-like nuclease
VSRVAGVDGARGGWVAVVAEEDGRPRELRFVEKFRDLLKGGEFDLIAVDMPMGFPDLAQKGGRDCERAARTALPGKTSSVFSAPSRKALAAKDYRDACARNGNGIGLSKQAFNLFPKMRELDAVLRKRPACRIVEAHPELGFARLAGSPVLEKKKTPEGRKRRLALLAKHGMGDVADWLDLLPRSLVAPDDVIDAAVVCLAALRILAGKGTCLPAKPATDRFGIEMAIWR